MRIRWSIPLPGPFSITSGKSAGARRRAAARAARRSARSAEIARRTTARRNDLIAQDRARRVEQKDAAQALRDLEPERRRVAEQDAHARATYDTAMAAERADELDALARQQEVDGMYESARQSRRMARELRADAPEADGSQWLPPGARPPRPGR